MTRRRKLVASLLAAVLASATLAGPASAGLDQKTFPALFCQQWGSAQTLNYHHGRVRNLSSGGAYADCPIMTDSPWGVIKGQILVNVVDRHYGEDVSCNFFHYDKSSGAPSFFWSQRRSSGSSNEVQVLDFDFRKNPIVQGQVFSPSMVSCYVPPRYLGNATELISYDVFEYEDKHIGGSGQ